MLEILILIRVAKNLGDRIRKKGHNAGWYQFLLVIFWFGGEFFGAVVGSVIGAILEPRAEPSLLIVYPLALAGAAAGAFLTFVIANQLPDLRPYSGGYKEQDYFEKDLDRGPGPEENYRPVADEYRPK